MRIIERHPDTVDSTVDGELVVLNVNTLEYFRFNDVAKSVWNLLASGPMSEEQVCDALLEEYDVELGECKASVAAFVDKALDGDFIRTVDAES